MLILSYQDVKTTLAGRELEMIDLVADVYVRHAQGLTSIPYSAFLRFPHNDLNRIIGLPAYVGGEPMAAGVKWVASFPRNIARGMERASAIIVLNSLETGRPVAVIEGSAISAARTAASAAAAIRLFAGDLADHGMAVIGCGLIARQVVRFARVTRPGLKRITAYDIEPGRGAAFARDCTEMGLQCSVAPDLPAAVACGDVVCMTTTAARPYVDVTACRTGALVLHLSLRDLIPAAIRACQNIVDDAGHVCREGTSIELAYLETGNKDFIDATIGEVISGQASFSRDQDRPLIFSPFGLGALDISLAHLVVEEARRCGLGTKISDFLPDGGECD